MIAQETEDFALQPSSSGRGNIITVVTISVTITKGVSYAYPFILFCREETLRRVVIAIRYAACEA